MPAHHGLYVKTNQAYVPQPALVEGNQYGDKLKVEEMLEYRNKGVFVELLYL